MIVDSKQHHDRQQGVDGKAAKDIKAGTNIYNFVISEEGPSRHFQLAEPKDIAKGDDGHGVASCYVFNKAMPSGSMIMLTAKGNKELKHRVPKEKLWKGRRISIVLRTVLTKAERSAVKKQVAREKRHLRKLLIAAAPKAICEPFPKRLKLSTLRATSAFIAEI